MTYRQIQALKQSGYLGVLDRVEYDFMYQLFATDKDIIQYVIDGAHIGYKDAEGNRFPFKEAMIGRFGKHYHTRPNKEC